MLIYSIILLIQKAELNKTVYENRVWKQNTIRLKITY